MLTESRRKRVGRAAKERRSQAPVESYSDARPDLVAGDLLCFRGKGFVNLAIRLFTRSPYSHAGLVFRYEERVYCLEAVSTGVRLILLSELIDRYHGGIDHYALENASERQRQRALSFSFTQLGKRFSMLGLFYFALAILFDFRRPKSSRPEWFCSEIIAEAYRREEFLFLDQVSCYIAPSDLVASSSVRLRRIIKQG